MSNNNVWIKLYSNAVTLEIQFGRRKAQMVSKYMYLFIAWARWRRGKKKIDYGKAREKKTLVKRNRKILWKPCTQIYIYIYTHKRATLINYIWNLIQIVVDIYVYLHCI